MTCITCNNNDAWHRRQLEHLEETIGPRAAQDFEQAHPETDDVDDLDRIAELEAEGMTTSDAQAVLDAERLEPLQRWSGSHPNHPHGSCDRCTDDDPGVRPTPYLNSTDRVIAEVGIELVDPTDRQLLSRHAQRRVNMAGGRYSDALRYELMTYRDLGREGYVKLTDESDRVAALHRS